MDTVFLLYVLLPPKQGLLESGLMESFTEQVPLVADDGVQRAAAIVHDVQQFAQSLLLWSALYPVWMSLPEDQHEQMFAAEVEMDAVSLGRTSCFVSSSTASDVWANYASLLCSLLQV